MKYSFLSLTLSASLVDQSLGERAVTSYAKVTLDYFSNLNGGIKRGDSLMGLLNVGIDADLEQVLGWKSTTFHLSAFSGHGTDFSARNVGDAGVVSNIFSPYDFNIFNIHLQTNFGGSGKSYFKFGQIAADDAFMEADTAGIFISSTFGPLNTQSLNTASPIFPLAAPGAVIHYEPYDRFSFNFGVYSGDLGGDDLDDRGFDWKIGGSAGYVIFAEGTWLISENTSAKLGGYYHTGEFENFATGSTTDNGLASFYGIIDHALVKDSLNIFARASIVTDEKKAVATSYLDAGMVWSDFLRPNASLGLAVSHTEFGSDYLAANIGVSDSETIIELTYQIPMNDRFIIQPDIQYILDAHESDSDVLVAGLRAQFEF